MSLSYLGECCGCAAPKLLTKLAVVPVVRRAGFRAWNAPATSEPCETQYNKKTVSKHWVSADLNLYHHSDPPGCFNGPPPEVYEFEPWQVTEQVLYSEHNPAGWKGTIVREGWATEYYALTGETPPAVPDGGGDVTNYDVTRGCIGRVQWDLFSHIFAKAPAQWYEWYWPYAEVECPGSATVQVYNIWRTVLDFPPYHDRSTAEISADGTVRTTTLERLMEDDSYKVVGTIIETLSQPFNEQGFMQRAQALLDLVPFADAPVTLVNWDGLEVVWGTEAGQFPYLLLTPEVMCDGTVVIQNFTAYRLATDFDYDLVPLGANKTVRRQIVQDGGSAAIVAQISEAKVFFPEDWCLRYHVAEMDCDVMTYPDPDPELYLGFTATREIVWADTGTEYGIGRLAIGTCPGTAFRPTAQATVEGESAPEAALMAAPPEPTPAGGGCAGCGPSLAEQAANLAEAVGRTAGRWLRGEAVLADDKQAAERLAVCAACDRLKGGRCQVCGCFVNAKAKLAGEQCPLGLWPA